MFFQEGNRLIRKLKDEILWLEPWGDNSIRVRATRNAEMTDQDWALDTDPQTKGNISIDDKIATLTCGNIKAKVYDVGGMVEFYNQKDELLLKEFYRVFDTPGTIGQFALRQIARTLRPIPGGDYELSMRFESNPDEKLYGMGQYQQEVFDLKGSMLELAHRNSQASVPFLVSSLGYGLLWNNPAIGTATFAKNMTEFTAKATKQLDYWITAGDTPAQIEKQYADVTGHAPMMPEYGMGLWQCKLRYLDQEELMSVAREYKKRGVKLDVIVVDFFHWTQQGDFKFEPEFWPDPEGMCKELAEMGTKLMVSIWPTVDFTSENYWEMDDKGFLVRADRGFDLQSPFCGNTRYYDTTHPGAREFVWNKAKQNYYDKGVTLFWLDEAEPEYAVYDYDNFRYHAGPVLQAGNIYPRCYSQGFYEGMKEASGSDEIMNLVRCAWAGSQKYGALVWSGDIDVTFDCLRRQVCAGLHMGLAGIPWWTTDIGGFHGGDCNDKDFQEVEIRWFQFAAFCPVLRMHGDRSGYTPAQREGIFGSGGDNEIWSYGDEAYEIFLKYIAIRENMRPYVRAVMKQAHEEGAPAMRTLFYEFPDDKAAWDISDQYMFGPDFLVCPVMYAGMRQREVYLPQGATWTDTKTGKVYDGGQTITVDAPLDTIPVFLKNGAPKAIFE